MDPTVIDEGRIRDVFGGRSGEPTPLESAAANVSAVLVGLHDGPQGVSVILTRRSQHVRFHTGEVSFPGGRPETGETSWQTALREAREEIDLPAERVDRLGELDHLTTVTHRASIAPMVGWLDRVPELRPHLGEVEEIRHVPLAELLSPDVFREERWGSPDLQRSVYFFELVGDTVWGATAALLWQFLCRCLELDPGPRERWDPAATSPWNPPPGFAGQAV
jgi:8-oxo-dGTP pyrophosphatase MutT (NUDIX family)